MEELGLGSAGKIHSGSSAGSNSVPGTPDTKWGRPNSNPPGSDGASKDKKPSKTKPPTLPVPLYIKSNDYASMRSCHLNGN
jgi:hypothetical protein